jgi:2-hydroxycyclohexanecarboxyl-CoA dehydrogenase
MPLGFNVNNRGLSPKDGCKMNNDNKVAVVTGGAKGIGKAIAFALAKKGYAVAILDPLSDGAKIAGQINDQGGRALYLSTDVSVESEVLQSADTIRLSLGTPTVLVNNAGIYPRSEVLSMPLELWNRVLSVNLTGAFLCSRTFAPDMLGASHGVIVNMASGRGLQGAKHGAHYAASKAGIISLTRTLALEWSPTIRCNAVIPGVTDTDQPREAGVTDEELYSRGAKIPMGRIGNPEDIANAVSFLISEEASYITGQCLCVNGGAIMH